MEIDYKQLTDFRQMLVSEQFKVCQLALSLHKQQEKIDDLIKVVDSWLIKGE